MPEIPFQRVAIVGLGLMGGSVAKTLRAVGYEGPIHAVLPSAAAVAALQSSAEPWRIELGHQLPEVLVDADLILLATPPKVLLSQLPEVARWAGPAAVITDLASTKNTIACRATEIFGARFVPGHPVVGSEMTGFPAAREDLYRAAQVVLTPLADRTDELALDKVRQFWMALGAEVQEMSPQAHDAALAATSHLPHLLAYIYLAGLAPQFPGLENLAGGGLRDFSRIVDSNPALWAEILQENQQAVRQQLQQLQQNLSLAEQLLMDEATPDLQSWLARGKTVRQQFHFPPVLSE
ncbi:prephenate dehydrogenase/arogenate dehydrogenase family protein [Acidithiobacillus sp. HP-6]|uniref:prephenate dehydrogenase n=1 Tax=unclassified Acidithiobacillus TaxID=2614800 RepID=UPI00187A7903|nr:MULTISPECIES: prephenate dehydrogenase/arogenate dehydrogenase family protein [unclassified Acidithiobacillus]MBE7562262.1 prephenate dehydrogenase/arogenate dehydrogenase family protein [Acidithiobacillus sp. HP-6]MBE7568987.1 prephenate dehydrogenase/arogenate dehydrogenase family protein [Acidithiobacillus sp. HP-2]